MNPFGPFEPEYLRQLNDDIDNPDIAGQRVLVPQDRLYTHDPITGEALVHDDSTKLAMSVSTGKIGNVVTLSIAAADTAGPLTTIAQYDSPDSRPRAVSVNLGMLPTLLPKQSQLEWVVQWGVGSSQFAVVFTSPYKAFRLVGNMVRVSARLVRVLGNTADSTTVSAHTAPIEGSGMGIDRVTAWNTNYALATSPTQLGTQAFQATQTGSDQYILAGHASGPAFAGLAQSVDVTRTDAGTQATYIMLIDKVPAAALPWAANGSIPIKVLGQLAAGGNASFDVQEGDPLPFYQGLIIAASSTSTVLTRDATVTLAVDWETRIV